MTRLFDRVAIIGSGLLGASLGLALKARGLAAVVHGVGHRQATLDTALSMGAVDSVSLTIGDECAAADLVVICTPAALVARKLDELRPICCPNAAVTDVASTKAEICAHALQTWPKPLRFVGSHPMAGSEKYGPSHARADLYDGCYVVVAPSGDSAPDAHAAVVGLWKALGATVVEMAPEIHDGIVARTSHVPHIIAACLALTAARNSADADIRPLVGQGFRDMTRIAAGRPEIWRDICLTNRNAVVDGLDALLEEIGHVRAAIANEDGERLDVFFQAGQEAREKAVEE